MCFIYSADGLVPRIPLIPSDSELPFQFLCLQFPFKPCGYMWLPLGLAAYSNLAYSYLTIRRAMWSTQKPCRTEERLSCFLIFIFHWQWKVIWFILIVLCILRAKAGTTATFYYWIIRINYLFKICVISVTRPLLITITQGGFHVKKIYIYKQTGHITATCLATHTPILGRVAQGALALGLPQIRKCHFLSDPCVFGYIF